MCFQDYDYEKIYKYIVSQRLDPLAIVTAISLENILGTSAHSHTNAQNIIIIYDVTV